jgi:hypothetical protein
MAMCASWGVLHDHGNHRERRLGQCADRLALRGHGDVIENERTRERAGRDETIAM